MGFKSPKQMLNAIIGGLDVERDIKAEKAKAEKLLKKLEVLAKTQTKEQKSRLNAVMRKYHTAMDGAEQAFRLTKAQIMVAHMMEQVEVYEKNK